MITKYCESCEQPFQVKSYRKDTARFCSKNCSGKNHAKQYLNNIQQLEIRKQRMQGNKLRVGLRPSNAFTSEQVKGENSFVWVESVKFICEYCKQEYTRKPWMVKQSNGKSRFCSRECFEKSTCFVGSKSTSYVGGKRTYRGRSWPIQRRKAIDRDKGVCQNCKVYIGNSIPVHHIIPFRDFKHETEANHIHNLICLCQSCHMKYEYSKDKKCLQS